MNIFEKLLMSLESKDYSKMTSLELFKLVDQSRIRPETADRLLKEISNVS